MIDLLVSALVVVVVGYYAFKLLTSAGIALDSKSYIAGIVVAALIGFFSYRIQKWYGTAMRPRSPQTVEMQTKETPIQITSAAVGGCLWFVIAMAVLLYCLYWLVKENLPQ